MRRSHLQPFGNEALRANLLSAILVAAACGVVGASVAYLTRRVLVGVGAGLGLAVTTEAWAVGLHADPHALHFLLAAVLLAVLVVWSERQRQALPADRWLIIAAAVYGVSLANHGLTLLLAPGIGLFVLATYPNILSRPRLIATCIAALALTTIALYAYLPIRSAMNPPLDYANPQTWEGFRYLVFGEQFRGTFQALPGPLDAISQIANETFGQLGLLAVLAPVGVVLGGLRRPQLVLMLGAWFVVNWIFALGYVNADIGRYYLVPLMASAMLGGLGAGELLDRAARLLPRPTDMRTSLAGRFIVGAAIVLLLVPPLAAIPMRYRAIDESHDTTARIWLQAMSSVLPHDAVVMSWWSYSTSLWYAQYIEHWRPDVTVIDDRTLIDQQLGDVDDVINAYLGLRPVYLMRLPFDLPRYETEYELTRVVGVPGDAIYRVDGRRPQAANGAANL